MEDVSDEEWKERHSEDARGGCEGAGGQSSSKSRYTLSDSNFLAHVVSVSQDVSRASTSAPTEEVAAEPKKSVSLPSSPPNSPLLTSSLPRMKFGVSRIRAVSLKPLQQMAPKTEGPSQGKDVERDTTEIPDGTPSNVFSCVQHPEGDKSPTPPFEDSQVANNEGHPVKGPYEFSDAALIAEEGDTTSPLDIDLTPKISDFSEFPPLSNHSSPNRTSSIVKEIAVPPPASQNSSNSSSSNHQLHTLPWVDNDLRKDYLKDLANRIYSTEVWRGEVSEAETMNERNTILADAYSEDCKRNSDSNCDINVRTPMAVDDAELAVDNVDFRGTLPSIVLSVPPEPTEVVAEHAPPEGATSLTRDDVMKDVVFRKRERPLSESSRRERFGVQITDRICFSSEDIPFIDSDDEEEEVGNIKTRSLEFLKEEKSSSSKHLEPASALSQITVSSRSKSSTGVVPRSREMVIYRRRPKQARLQCDRRARFFDAPEEDTLPMTDVIPATTDDALEGSLPSSTGTEIPVEEMPLRESTIPSPTETDITSVIDIDLPEEEMPAKDSTSAAAAATCSNSDPVSEWGASLARSAPIEEKTVPVTVTIPCERATHFREDSLSASLDDEILMDIFVTEDTMLAEDTLRPEDAILAKDVILAEDAILAENAIRAEEAEGAIQAEDTAVPAEDVALVRVLNKSSADIIIVGDGNIARSVTPESDRNSQITTQEINTLAIDITPFRETSPSEEITPDAMPVEGEARWRKARPESLDEEALLCLLQELIADKSPQETTGIMSVERRGTKALELWARRVTDGYNGVAISNMTTDWRNGLAFCALIHRFRPDLIDYASLKPENILENNALAFRVAEQQLGIPALLDAEDMVECEVPDRLSVMTYVSQYYQAFLALGLTSPKRVVNTSSSSPPPSSTITTNNKLTTPPQPKIRTEIKPDKVLIGGRGRREVCVGCSNPVFLAQRLLVGSPGQLMHRTCFRCARCDTQLTLASYYETEKGKFCCETCPDEERTTVLPDIVKSSSIGSSTSHKLKRQSSASDSESESDSDDDSGDNSDTYSHDAESLLEDKIHVSDTKSDTLSHSPTPIPGPPKPRTVFLSQTLEGANSENDSMHKETNIKDDESHFSKVSPVLFGSKVEHSQTVVAKSDSGPDNCDDAKGLLTDPPEKLTLDTGQGNDTNSLTQGATKTSSSIVAERLKMFREISSRNYSTDKTNTKVKDVDKCDARENYQNVHKNNERNYDIQITNERDIKDNYREEYEKVDDDTDHYKNTKNINADNAVEIDKTYELEETGSEYAIDKVEKAEPELEVAAIPSNIVFSSKTENAKVLPEEDNKIDAAIDNFQITSPEESVSTNDMHKEYNPFEDEDESQQDESGVAVNQILAGSDVDSSAVVISQDSGADVSSPSLHSIQYPDDLNPFGSDDADSEAEGLNDGANVSQDNSTTQGDEEAKPAKKLIKVNLNPFESDENEEEKEDEEEFAVVESKKESEEKKNLNPFWSDDEDEIASTSSTPSKAKVKPPRPPPPTLARNSTPSQVYGYSSTNSSPASESGTTSRKKISAPPQSSMRELFPGATASHISSPSSPSLSAMRPPPSPSSPGSVALKKKGRRAPVPPQAATPKNGRKSPTSSTTDSISVDTVSLSSAGTHNQGLPEHGEDQDEVLSWKMQKDLKNHSNKMNGTTEQRGPPPKPARAALDSKNLTCVTDLTRRPSLSKSEAGEWQRKKGPAPLRPVPQKRALKKLPMRVIQQELQDIDLQQSQLERQGVLLETAIRNKTEDDTSSTSSGPSSIEVEDMILQLFELVNEKNELFRRQTELMYLKREKRLEEDYVELEYQIRCLMLKHPSEKTEVDSVQEEELIARLVKVVEQRDEIINCLELDRLREAQEDESIATHMMQYQEKHIHGVDTDSTTAEEPKKRKALRLPKKKKKKEKKDKKGIKGDADKDIDETEAKETKKKKKKKKWLF